MLKSPNTHRLSAVVGAWRRSPTGVSVQVDLRDRWFCSGCGWQRGKTAGLAAPSTRGVSTRSPMCKQDLAHRTVRLSSSFLILTHKSQGIPQKAHRGLLTGPGPQFPARAKENIGTYIVLSCPSETDPEDESVLSSWDTHLRRDNKRHNKIGFVFSVRWHLLATLYGCKAALVS